MSPLSPFLAPERDNALKEGRPKKAGTDSLSIPGTITLGIFAISEFTGADVYAPWATRTPIIIDRLACEVTSTGAGNIRIGFYAADTDFQPVGAPLADSGDISCGTTGVKTYTPATPIVVPRGRYVSVFNLSAAASFRAVTAPLPATSFIPTLSASPTHADTRVTRAHAAFPTPGTAWDTYDNSDASSPTHIVFYRVSSP